jgi:hypothetical protein
MFGERVSKSLSLLSSSAQPTRTAAQHGSRGEVIVTNDPLGSSSTLATHRGPRIMATRNQPITEDANDVPIKPTWSSAPKDLPTFLGDLEEYLPHVDPNFLRLLETRSGPRRRPTVSASQAFEAEIAACTMYCGR